jgi:NAD kinase
MDRQTENKIILITRRTRLEDLIARFNTAEQAKFYIEHSGADFSDYQLEHDTYRKAIALAEDTLRTLGRVLNLDRAFLPNFIFGENDGIIVIGQDGLVANVLKYTIGHPVVAINPDPSRFDGVLLPFRVNDLKAIMPEALERRRPVKEITMAKATLHNGQILYGVNDLFIGARTHVSARYQIRIGKVEERQSSSGIIVSTGLGSTGWLKSILAGAEGIARFLGKGPIQADRAGGFAWNADYLVYSVREPFPSKWTQVSLVFGRIESRETMVLTSNMPENGVIFSDGIEADYCDFNSGVSVTVGVAEKKGLLVQ